MNFGIYKVFLSLSESSLPHVKARCKLYGTAHVRFVAVNQTGNKHFVCSLSGSQFT